MSPPARPLRGVAALLGRPLSLGWHLGILIGAVLLPALLVVTVSVYLLGQQAQELSERRLLQSARDLSAAVDREIGGSLRALAVLAEASELDDGDLAAFHTRAARVAAREPAWQNLILHDVQGTPRLSTQVPWGQLVPPPNDPGSLRQTVQTQRPQVGDATRGPRQGWAFAVRVPVVRGGEVRYVLSAVVRVQALAELVASALPASDEFVRAIVDARGIVIARTREPERFVGRPAAPAFLARIGAGSEGVMREASLDGHDLYVGFSRAPLSGWTAVIAVPSETVVGSQQRSVAVIVVLSLLLLGGASLAVFVVARRVAQAMASAADGADRALRGERPQVDSAGIAEIERLGQALERSAERLARSHRERDQHLAATEAARADAEAASRAKDDFLAMLGHELRNPLAPIRNGVYLLGRLGPPDPKARQILAMIERQVAHMVRLIDDLLDASRIAHGKFALKREPCELGALLAQVVEDYRGDFEAARVVLDYVRPDAPVRILADATRLVQCVSNLLNNALKFTPAAGRVTLTLAEDAEGGARIEVADTGIGIEPALLSQLFQVFAQAPQALDRAGGGLGLGLALAKGIVELHGGRIEAHSAGADTGTHFVIHLPRGGGPATGPA